MKKFVNNVKAAVGNIDHTKDEEAEELIKELKGTESIPRDVKSAASRMKSTTDTIASNFENMAKAFERIAKEQDASEESKAIAKQLLDAIKEIKNTYNTKYKSVLEEGEITMKTLADAFAAAKKMESDREDKLKKYDVIRVTVDEKEAKYREKGKDLSDSKKYQEEVDERDRRKRDYEEANEKFKEKAKEVLALREKEYLQGMKAWADETAAYFEGLSKLMTQIKNATPSNTDTSQFACKSQRASVSQERKSDEKENENKEEEKKE